MYFNVGSKKNRGLREGEVTLQIGNRIRVTAMAMDTYPLWLSSRFSLILRDHYYIPAVNKKLISISSDYGTIYSENKLVACGFTNDSLYHLHMDVCVNISE